MAKANSSINMPAEDECYVIIARRNRTIEVFHEGVLKLWYRNGKWEVPKHYGAKYLSLLQRKIGDLLRIKNKEYLVALTKTVWELVTEEHKGALFVFGRIKKAEKSRGYRMTDVLPFAEGQVLATASLKHVMRQLAEQDGATFVDACSGQVFGRRFLAVPMPRVVSEISEWHWGAKRTSAKLLSMNRQDLVSIAISVDGSIDVFYEGTPQKNLHYP